MDNISESEKKEYLLLCEIICCVHSSFTAVVILKGLRCDNEQRTISCGKLISNDGHLKVNPS